MRTAGFWPPLMVTRPTPLSCEIFGASLVSTRSSTCDRGMVLDVAARASTGGSAGVVLLYIGGEGRFAGRKLDGALITDSTSSTATSMFKLRVNCRTITDVPPELLEVIWFRPCNWPNCRSRGAVTVVATTSGLAPG